MTYARHETSDAFDPIPRMPTWITSGRMESLEDAAFLSGSALSYLHHALSMDDVPHSLLRGRLALRAAEACVSLAGRPERAGELRDAIAFLQPGDEPGPAGEIYLSWRRSIERPVSVRSLRRALAVSEPGQIAGGIEAGNSSPVVRAAASLEAVLDDSPRDITSALLLGDATMALALGWSHVTPLLAYGLRRADLQKKGGDLRLACHRAVVSATTVVSRELADLTRRANRLRAVAHRLRARGSDEAVALFLALDAVAPAALSSLRSDRAARRFCDRLVKLGVARELTGRDTFRLYGL